MDELRKIYADKRVGEHFEFGRYPQGTDGEIKPILWRVLQRVIHPVSWRTTWRMLKREKEYLLVLAEQGLDSKPYHEKFCGITWAECSLRRWLNGEFYLHNFSEDERGLILLARVTNNFGPNTEDRVFLLSVAEAESLFADDTDRRAVPTAWTVKNGVSTFDDGCWWWLRSRGCNHLHASDVDPDGVVLSSGDGVGYANRAVRPAVRLVI